MACTIFQAANATLNFAYNTLKSKIGRLCPRVLIDRRCLCEERHLFGIRKYGLIICRRKRASQPRHKFLLELVEDSKNNSRPLRDHIG